MLASQLEAVCEVSGRAPELVAADSGYAYSEVYAALERRGVAALIPTKKEPTQSRVPLRLFRYDARHDVVKCPRGKILRPCRSNGQARCFGSRARDCAGCGLRPDCLPKGWRSKELVPHAYPALLRARRGEEERRLWRRHMSHSEGYHGEAKSWHGLGWAVRRGLVNMRIQSCLTAMAVNLKRLAAALEARLFTFWRACTTRKHRMRAHGVISRRLGLLSAAGQDAISPASETEFFNSPSCAGFDFINWQRRGLPFLRLGRLQKMGRQLTFICRNRSRSVPTHKKGSPPLSLAGVVATSMT